MSMKEKWEHFSFLGPSAEKQSEEVFFNAPLTLWLSSSFDGPTKSWSFSTPSNFVHILSEGCSVLLYQGLIKTLVFIQ